jgi:hypothetical protein
VKGMESKNTIRNENENLNQNQEKGRNYLKKDSIQYNCQDLDQEQNVNVNPVQNVHIHLENAINYSASITGITYYEKNIIKNVEIFLFFGLDLKIPVYKTNSDDNGNFNIKDMPSGYYTLYAQLGDNLKYVSSFIKLLPCDNINHNIHLSNL